MASETMTLADAIQVCERIMPTISAYAQDIRAVAAMQTLLSHARATTAGTVRDPMTRDDIYREFAKGEDADGLYHVQMDEMADEIIRLRTTAGTGAEQRFVCGGTLTPEGQKELDDFATYLRVKGRIEKQKQTGAGGGRVTAAMVEAAARVLFRQLAEENYALIHPDDIKVTREALRAALQAAGVGA